MERVEIVAADGVPLAATVFAPAVAPRGGVLMVPAMGVTQSYYRAFADWLARSGYLAITFDFRGIGRSLRGSLRDERADVVVWGERDCTAMLDALAERAPDVPLYWIGHSLGAQLLPFAGGTSRLRRVITVAAGSGYWGDMERPRRYAARYLWTVMPLFTRAFGYFPGRRLRKVGDLPRGVAEQWRRWCLDPDYSVGAEGDGVRRRYAGVATPISALSFADDELMSLRNTESLLGFYSGAPRTLHRIAPADAGSRKIGHFGFFRPQFEASLWVAHLLPELSDATA